MANRRMFSKSVTRTDSFLDMSQGTQNLYFHLGLEADDDGFVNPKIVMRILGSTQDDLKTLLAKGFVIPFESGIMVIRHWRENNYLRSDRYKASLYAAERSKLLMDENGIYQHEDEYDPTGKSDKIELKRLGTPKVHPWLTQDRIGEDRIGEESLMRLETNPKEDSLAIKKDLVASDDLFPETEELALADWLFRLWNKYPLAESVGAKNPKNTYAKSQLLKPCKKLTADIVSAVNLWKKRPRQDLEDAIRAYITEILNRNPKSDYAKHRFSFYEFFSQPNGIKKFLNL